MESCDKVFEMAKIRNTAVRQLVWKAVSEFDYAFSLADLEAKLCTVDKSSLFRTLTLFKEKELLHEVDDGSGSVKYCVCDCCDGDHDHIHHQHHVHITCVVCKKTFCLKKLTVPLVNIPKDFVVEEINYVVKGVCSKCRKNRCER